MIYQLKVTLENSKPPIWRRIEVLPESTLEDFHKILQTTMGWMNGHLHHFIVGNEFYNLPNEWDDYGMDYRGIKINDFLKVEGQKIRYEYDFGDSWLHEIKLEKIVAKDQAIIYPRCIKGKRACPPEDCGGIWGYTELEQIMKDKKHKQYKEMLEWLGRPLDPENFKLDRINEKLRTKDFGVFSYDF